MGFGALRVINEDRIAGTQGFGEHSHSDMEILTYVIEGELQHRDSMGNGSIIRPNEIQYMSAGSGVSHSEFNPGEEAVHLLQIWIEPNVYGAVPRYQEQKLQPAQLEGLELIVSGDGREGSVAIRQEADVYRGKFVAGKKFEFVSREKRIQWVQNISGELNVGEQKLQAGDACGVRDEKGFLLAAGTDAHFLVFDLLDE